MRVLTLSTLYPDAARPRFGTFVAAQTRALAACADTAVAVVAPVGIPPWPLRRHPRYAALAALPTEEVRDGLAVARPRFTVWPGSAGGGNAAALLRAATPVVDRLRERFAFDVIHASFFYPDGPAAIALGERYGVPVSIKARGADVHHWGHVAATRAQVLSAARAADGLLAVSAALRDDLVALGMPGDRIAIHRTGIDAMRFAPADDRAGVRRMLGIDGPFVLSIGALIPRKGHAMVVDAIARLPGVTLGIAGEGPERGALLRRIARARLSPRVRLLGGVGHEDLPRWLAAADVMALASQSEGLANAWVEALACGTPIVITDAGGARELLTDPLAGRIVPRDPGAIAAAIGELLAAPPPRMAVRQVVADYSWATNGATLRAHLAGLIRSHRQGG